MKILSSALLIIFLPIATIAKERPSKPNVVLILTDDLGWQDVKCYDIDEPSPMETPNIDRLAERGVKFWQAYSPAPTCAPSRCAIMSGNHPARAQKTHVVGGAPPTPNHKLAWSMIAPWYSGRMPANEMTIARVLRENGYVTGHSGKWHMAIDHKAFPQPEDQGFDWTRSSRGARSGMSPNRLTNFATYQSKDPFKLDQNGFPFHQTNEDALTFLRQNNANPFFLYYATWLVHTPIHTRAQDLLKKYCEKLKVEYPTNPKEWTLEGQRNPYYCAMVEELDYYIGTVLHYLSETDDPRWPGHKLEENTYIIFTSDNGGMEGHAKEVITDNYPLDKGKISAMEGGTRVPLIIAGPGIQSGVESDVMVNGLDFYPTLLSLTKSKKPEDKNLDGSDLSNLLLQDPANPKLIRDSKGKVRDTMIWHFPNSAAFESTIRIGDYKLIRNYNHKYFSDNPEFELYQLYKTDKGKQTRVDIEESQNLALQDPKRTQSMNRKLTEILAEMKASYPYYNPHCRIIGPEKKKAPSVISTEQKGNQITIKYKENGTKLVQADLIYSLNGNARYEEWFRVQAKIRTGGIVTAEIPSDSTHFFVNLVDENNFFVSFPECPDYASLSKTKDKFAKFAIPVE